MTKTLDTIKSVLVNIKALSQSPGDIPDDTSLTEDIELDLIELLNFMLEIEAQLAIRIDFDQMEYSTLGSLKLLAAFLDRMPSTHSDNPA